LQHKIATAGRHLQALRPQLTVSKSQMTDPVAFAVVSLPRPAYLDNHGRGL
jgi:hypothetical protein